MASKPKPCKYGCGTIITWNETQRFFMAPDGQKHDCRDWPGVGSNGGAQSQGQVVTQGNGQYAPAPQSNQETLIGVQAKKTWENYFKHLEAINPNLVSIHSVMEESNGLLVEIIKALKSLEDQVAVLTLRTANNKEEEKKDV